MLKRISPWALVFTAALMLTAVAAYGEAGEQDAALQAQEVCLAPAADLDILAGPCGEGRCRTIGDCGGGCPGTTSCVGGSSLTCGICTCHIQEQQSTLFTPAPAPAAPCPSGTCRTVDDCRPNCPGTPACIGGSNLVCGHCSCFIAEQE